MLVKGATVVWWHQAIMWMDVDFLMRPTISKNEILIEMEQSEFSNAT